jgi:DNA polymerase/3'-5' exonuclease PolX
VYPHLALGNFSTNKDLRDLCCIEQLDNKKMVDEVLYFNISKRELLTNTVRNILQYKDEGYNFKRNPKIMDYVWRKILAFSSYVGEDITSKTKEFLQISKKLETNKN